MYLPKKLETHKANLGVNIELEEVCNGVVNPITKVTMTSYKQVINCLTLCRVWMKAMCKELGNIAQSYSNSRK